MENIVRKGEIACIKQFLHFSQCFLPYVVLIFHFKCTLKCCLRFVSIWTSLKFRRHVMGQICLFYGRKHQGKKRKCWLTSGKEEKMLVISSFSHNVFKASSSGSPNPIAQSVALWTCEQVVGLIPCWPIFLPRIDDSHCDRIHSGLTAGRFFDNVHVGKQPGALKEYFAEYWLKEMQESMDRCIGHRDTTEILLKMMLKIIQSLNLLQGH